MKKGARWAPFLLSRGQARSASTSARAADHQREAIEALHRFGGEQGEAGEDDQPAAYRTQHTRGGGGLEVQSGKLGSRDGLLPSVGGAFWALPATRVSGTALHSANHSGRR
jgi:hypothetical protein